MFITIDQWYSDLKQRSPTTAEVYKSCLNTFMKDQGLTDKELVNLAKVDLGEIEFLTEQWAKFNEYKVSSSKINCTYAALKDYLYVNRVIKNKRLFRQYTPKIKRSSVFSETMLEFDDVKSIIIDYAEGLKEKIIIGLYSFSALRPSLIPQILMKHCEIQIFEDHVTVTKPMMIKVPRTANDNPKKRRIGNKGNIDFITFAKTEVSEWIEQYLNDRIRSGEKLTQDSVLVELSGSSLQRKKQAVDYVVHKLYDKINFSGRPYLLRHFGDNFLKAVNDRDLKEWLMGHNGKISAIYDFGHGLTKEAIETYRAKYLIADRKYPLFGITDKEKAKVDTIITFAKSMVDLNKEQIEALKRLLNEGKLSLRDFEERLQQITRDAMNRMMKTQFERMFLEMANKHGLNNNNH